MRHTKRYMKTVANVSIATVQDVNLSVSLFLSSLRLYGRIRKLFC
jgi:hypothetical protein